MGKIQMSKKNIIVLIGFIFIVTGCNGMGREYKDWGKKDREFEEKMITKRHPYYFYNAIYIKDVNLVKKFLEAGVDPNRCKGENGWVDSNPLKVVVEGFFNTYDYRNQKPKNISEPVPDVAIIQLLVVAGADINRLPYVWDRVYRWGNEKYKWIIDQRKIEGLSLDPDIIQMEMETYVKDANRVLAALLEAGADPDKLGHPFPFSYDWKVSFLTDKKANKYFIEGTRAINEAIKKGITWESQVDLLLKYTKLDENSILAARESNDPIMIEKITKLWEIQGK